LLDSLQAAALLRIHPKTLQQMARRGDSCTQSCSLQSRRSLGVARQKLDYAGASERQGSEGTSRVDIAQLRSLLEHLKKPGKTAVLVDILTDCG
jgi:hypothetical protein